MAKLGEVCIQITDGSHNPPSGVEQSEYLMLSSKNIDDDFITLDSPRFLSHSDYIAENKRTTVSEGDLLMTIVGTIGRVAIVPEELKGICLQRSVAVIKPEREVVNNRYLMYQLQNMRPFLEKEARGVAQKGIYLKQVSQLDIKLPELEHQMQIVKVLDKASKLIFLRRQQLAKLDELVKARFVEMFGNPSNNSLGFPYEPLSNCLLSIENGKSFVCSNDMRQEENPAILKLSAVTYGVYQQDENKAILDSSMFVKSAEVHKGDLLFTRKNTPELVGMCAYVNDTAPNLMMPDLIFRLNTNEKINKIFLWKLINHEFFRGKIQNIATGSAKSMSNISKERLEKLAIILPPLHLQNDFAALVERVDQQKQTIQQSLEKLELLKKALMQEYFG